KVTEFLKGTDEMSKTIVFCVDIEHAQGMRSALANANPEQVSKDYKYVMQITGDNEEGKRELDNFIDPEQSYPVIATTSKLMTTGVDSQTCKVIVLDSNIGSTTEFKQIIGRGTRINVDHGKLYFTILDFRNATDHFADPDFDGPPIRIKEAGEDTDIGDTEEEEQGDGDLIPDTEDTGDDTEPTGDVLPPDVRRPGDLIPTEKREKIFVNGIDVSVLVSREMHFDNNGRPITVSLKDHTRDSILNNYASMEDFLTKWNAADRKEAIIKDLEEQGVLVEALQKAVNKDLDLFDLICHIAFGQKPLTRKERANNVRKRNMFTKYGDQARKVLDSLLDKYMDEGIENMESFEVLKVKPLNSFGSPVEIIKAFGGKDQYMLAIKELEKELYKRAS
ncbi:MAG: restriction endonuclease, partial [Chitinophagaceae bacterium]